jgi:glycosyltransferase involved in cell wall biosynthesis
MVNLIKNEVCVVCSTYNQSSYVKDTLNGFCAQQTNFPFLCIIIDDASTDGEQEVLKNYILDNFYILGYPDFIKKETDDYVTILAQHKSNINCRFVLYLLKYNHYRKKDKRLYYTKWIDLSKYVAYCEGDDYWIDPLKLQKQYDILKSNDDISLVFTGFHCIDEKGNNIYRHNFEKLMEISKTGDIFYEMLKQNFIMTLTTFYKKEIVQSSVINNAPCSQDYLYTLYAAAVGKVAYIPEKTGCYRYVSSSLSNSRKRLVYETNQHIGAYLSKLYLKGSLPQRAKKLHKKIKRRILWNKCLFGWYLFKMKIERILNSIKNFRRACI